MEHPPDYEKLVPRALNGDLPALEEIIRSIKDQIFNLSMRFLWHPQDAEDATQEIILKIVLHLSQFEFRSAFTTWTYRIAMNYLIDAKRSRLERSHVSFDAIGDELRNMPSQDPHKEEEMLADAQWKETIERVKTACTHAMLHCLDRENRAAFLLGELFGMDSRDAAWVLSISPEAYRQRLSRARSRVQDFMHSHCGLMNSSNKCRCSQRACQIQSKSLLDRYLTLADRLETIEDYAPPSPADQLSGELEKLMVIYRHNRRYRAPQTLLVRIRRGLGLTSD
ncbi:MAG: RNA polymerase sigma factor [Leptospiraceae bacterium]|nr:RNA polymerase sigma factor [Leptospiraceae bacterium]